MLNRYLVCYHPAVKEKDMYKIETLFSHIEDVRSKKEFENFIDSETNLDFFVDQIGCLWLFKKGKMTKGTFRSASCEIILK